MSMWIRYRIFEWFRCLAVNLLFNFCHNFKQILYYPKILDICKKKEKTKFLYNIVGISLNIYISFVKFSNIVSITNYRDVNKIMTIH